MEYEASARRAPSQGPSRLGCKHGDPITCAPTRCPHRVALPAVEPSRPVQHPVDVPHRRPLRRSRSAVSSRAVSLGCRVLQLEQHPPVQSRTVVTGGVSTVDAESMKYSWLSGWDDVVQLIVATWRSRTVQIDLAHRAPVRILVGRRRREVPHSLSLVDGRI